MTSVFIPRQNPPLPEGWQQLYSAVLSDALDAIGIWNQAMSPKIRPLDESLKLCGRARTGQYMEVPFVAEGTNPYELEIAIVDDLKPGDLVFGDADGVVVVPQAVEAEVLQRAFDKVNGEHHSMNELRAGGFLRDVYAKYGVL